MLVSFFFVQNAYKAFLRECFHNNVPTARRSFCKEEDEVWDQIKKSIFFKNILSSILPGLLNIKP